MKQLEWMEFMRLVADERPRDPALFAGNSKKAIKAREEAQAYWTEWHKYVADVLALARKPETEALVLFRNIDFNASAFGRKTVLAVGKTLTYKAVGDLEGKWLYDLPSQRQYPEAWVSCLEKTALVDPVSALTL